MHWAMIPNVPHSLQHRSREKCTWPWWHAATAAYSQGPLPWAPFPGLLLFSGHTFSSSELNWGKLPWCLWLWGEYRPQVPAPMLGMTPGAFRCNSYQLQLPDSSRWPCSPAHPELLAQNTQGLRGCFQRNEFNSEHTPLVINHIH